MTEQPPTDLQRDFRLSAFFSLLIFLIGGGLAVFVMTDPRLKSTVKAARTLASLEENYPAELDWDEMLADGISAMTDELDRFSGYLDQDYFNRRDEELSGSYSGIGVSVVGDDQGLLVMAVRRDGPAATAGMLIGDLIVKVDSTDVTRLSANDAVGILRGTEGSTVQVTILRKRLGEPPLQDTITTSVKRQSLKLQHIPYAGFTEDSIIYIRLADFESGTAAAVKQMVDSLQSVPGQHARAIILDLRGNPGGLLTEAIDAAQIFLPEGKLIVGTKGRSRWSDTQFHADGGDLTDGMPMAVMVDDGSASASEIVAGALKQQGRALLVGDTTYGKGLVQGFTRFQDGSGLRLTISRYYLEGNLFLNRFDSTLEDTGQGIAPHIYVRSVEHEPFLRTLESSRLLLEFAIERQQRILSYGTEFSLDPGWTDSLKHFAKFNGFIYHSDEYRVARWLYDLAKTEAHDHTLVSLADSLLAIARFSDTREFDEHSDYICFRLQQIALERSGASAATISALTVRKHPDILHAAALLRQRI